MPTPAIAPLTVQAEVHRLYSELDPRGRRVWSYASIAKLLGLSETTVQRIIRGLGPYQHERPVVTVVDEQVIRESTSRLLDQLKEAPTANGPDTPADPFSVPNPFYSRDD